MKYVDFDDEFMLIRKPMNHPNFIIRNYLMGESAGGLGERGGECQGERISWFSAQTLFSSRNSFCSRTTCFQDVCSEQGCLQEASVRFKGIA